MAFCINKQKKNFCRLRCLLVLLSFVLVTICVHEYQNLYEILIHSDSQKITFRPVPLIRNESHMIVSEYNAEHRKKLLGLIKVESCFNSLYPQTKNASKEIQIVPETKCSEPYLSIANDGRLGNNICQYLSLLVFRKRFGIRVAILQGMKNTLSKVLKNVSTPLQPSKCFPQNKSSYISTNFQNMYKMISNSTAKMKHRNFIYGFPCLIDYLIEYRDEFYFELPIREDIRKRAQNILQDNLRKMNYDALSVTLVSVHVRRTDYIGYTKRRGIVMPTQNYYKNAMELYKQREPNVVVFVVITDDPKWSKRNLVGENIIFPGTSKTISPQLDYVLITLCHHHIVSVGTFGFTGAFFGNGTIVYFSSKKTKRSFSQLERSGFCTPNIFIPVSE